MGWIWCFKNMVSKWNSMSQKSPPTSDTSLPRNTVILQASEQTLLLTSYSKSFCNTTWCKNGSLLAPRWPCVAFLRAHVFSIIYWWSINPKRSRGSKNEQACRSKCLWSEKRSHHHRDHGPTLVSYTMSLTELTRWPKIPHQLSVTKQWSCMCWQSTYPWLQCLFQELQSSKTLGPEQKCSFS